MPAPHYLDYGTTVQYAIVADKEVTWFCPVCKAWGTHPAIDGSVPRLSFAHTSGQAHMKVAHYA